MVRGRKSNAKLPSWFRGLFACCVGIVLAFWIKKPKNRIRSIDAERHRPEQTDCRDENGNSLPTCPKKKCRDNNSKEPIRLFRLLTISEAIQVFVGFALIWVGCQQLGVYRGQATIADIQADIMNTQTAISRRQLTASETDKRPWLRVAVSLSRPVELYDWSGNKGVDATFKFDIKNFGESPAINIRIAHPMVLHPGNVRRFELNKPQQDACAVARKDADANTIGGVTAFPGEPVSIEEGSGNSFPRDGSPTLFAVLGCVDYTFAGNRHGQTGFNYMLGTVENGQVVGIPFTEGKPRPYETRTWSDYFSLQALVKDGYPSVPPNTFDIPVSHLYFKPSDMGNYAK